MIIRVFFFILTTFIGWLSPAQDKYWIDNTSTECLNSALLPPPTYCSEWIKSCSYVLSKSQAHQLIKEGITLDLVDQFAPAAIGDHFSLPTLGFALEQVKAGVFIDKGLNGKGVKIGIIDGGFLGADKDETLKHFFENDLVKYYKDYVTPKLRAYGGLKGLDDNHGTEVWQAIGGYNVEKNIQYGLATAAIYYLARTDHGGYEKRIEEDYLIKALEEMHKKGVKLVNISLGYNLGFTNPSENYSIHEMDGKSTALAKAVDHAALKKGMLIIVAAGNEGGDKWETLSTPGDARHALTVGSSKFEVWDKMGYSSIGPDFTDFVKPDIAVYSTMGTSYSTPIVTGMAACIWQMDSTLTNLEIIDIFKKAGNFYPYPNNYLGYGVPTCPRILEVMNGQPAPAPKEIRTKKAQVKLEVDKETKYIVAFHKKDERNVLSRVVYRPIGAKVKVKRLEGSPQMTLLIDTEIIEVFWE